MASIDPADAYNTLSVLFLDQKYLPYQFEGQLYKYTCFSNALTSAPRIFTKFLKTVFSVYEKQGHQMMVHLDDIFLIGDTSNEWKDAVLSSPELVLKLGFQIYSEKSKLLFS